MCKKRCSNYCWSPVKRILSARRTIAAMLVLGVATTVQADEVHVAVATNFLATLKIIAQRFETATGARVHISTASTGKLFAQIQQGAPFDVFLAADAEHARLLEQQGLAVQGSRYTYAVGRLALWSAQPGMVDEQGKIVSSGSFRHLAIANPKISPYGRAARQTLERLGVWKTVQARLVQGEDIGQTLQFVATGNAELGFVALAQVLNLPAALNGSYWLVPQDLHQPLEQQAVLLRRAATQRTAQAFMAALQSTASRALIKQSGY